MRSPASALALFCLALTLGACAPRGLVRIAPAAVDATVEPIYFASNRDLEGAGLDTGRRMSRITYGRIDIAVPPARRLGQLRYPPPQGPVDTRRDFVATGLRTYPDGAGFEAAIRKALRTHPQARGEVVVYVHGFNSNFADTTFRFAQIVHDVGVHAVNVAFDWPSDGKPLKYLYDRDSVLFSRNGMVTMLNGIRRAGARSILIVAHSMGTELTMEALRTLALSGDRATLDRINGVILVSADMDTQLFRREAKEIGRLPQPFVLFVSDKDPVLGLSAALTGRASRIGNLRDLGKVSSLHLTVINVSAYRRGAEPHFVAATSPALLKLLAGAGGVSKALEDKSGPLGKIMRTFGQQG